MDCPKCQSKNNVKNGVVVSSLKAGTMFGEYGSLGYQVRNATVKAMESGVILKVF